MVTESGAMGHLWPKDGKLEAMFDNLTKEPNPHMKVYKKKRHPRIVPLETQSQNSPDIHRPSSGLVHRAVPRELQRNLGRTGHTGGHPRRVTVTQFSSHVVPNLKNFEVQPFSTLECVICLELHLSHTMAHWVMLCPR